MENQVTKIIFKKTEIQQKKNIERCAKATKYIAHKKQIYLIGAKRKKKRKYTVVKKNAEAFVVSKLTEGKKGAFRSKK